MNKQNEDSIKCEEKAVKFLLVSEVDPNLVWSALENGNFYNLLIFEKKTYKNLVKEIFRFSNFYVE